MFLGVKDVCDLVGCSYNTLMKYKESGYLIPALQSKGGRDKYSVPQVEAFIVEYCHGTADSLGDELMNVGEVREYTGLGISILNRLEDEKELVPCRRLPISNKRLYSKKDVDAFLIKHT